MFEKEMQEITPELISRRGESNAWMLTGVVSAAMAIMYWKLESIPVAAWIFWALLLFSGLSISLGNWVERKTIMQIGADGIMFQNGLRNVDMSWHEVKKVNVLPLRWGKSVQVIGESAHFEFRTLGEVEFQGESRGRLGFVQGEDVLAQILKSSSVVLQKEEKGAYYYACV